MIKGNGGRERKEIKKKEKVETKEGGKEGLRGEQENGKKRRIKMQFVQVQIPDKEWIIVYV